MSKQFLDDVDIHVHFPAAATPKDGPSAGITITTALVRLFFIFIQRMWVKRDKINIYCFSSLSS